MLGGHQQMFLELTTRMSKDNGFFRGSNTGEERRIGDNRIDISKK